MNAPIILVDFSKVISPIGISRHLADLLSQHLNLSKEQIRDRYKQHISLLVKGKFPILEFIEELLPFLKPEHTKKNLIDCISTMPPVSFDFLETLKILKQTHTLYLASDIYPELWYVVKKKLTKYFDAFIFSFEQGYKKSETQFWEQLKHHISFNNVSYFIDDKQENLDLAKQYGIQGILYTSDLTSHELFKAIYTHTNTIILGAGAAGIHYGSLLQEHNKDYLILEKEKYPYGLMKSYKLGNSFYDLGWHALHNHNDQILNFLTNKWIASDKQARKAFIDYKNRLIPFPFQLHLRYLDQDEKRACLKDFVRVALETKAKKVANLDDYLQMTFWAHIYRSFLKPYNQKIWKTNLKMIATNWTRRISYESFEHVLKGYFEANEENYGTNSQVNYPKKWGFQSYLVPFFKTIEKNLCYDISITKIDYKNHLLYTNQGVYYYQKIISTIPLNEFLDYCNITQYRNIFDYLSLQVIAILTKKQENSSQRIYNHEKQYYHHKLAINTNSSFAMQQENATLFQFEISSKNNRKKSKSLAAKNAIEYLQDKKLITSENDILQIEYQEVKYAYPIQTLDLLKQKSKIIKKLNKLSIYPLGRFGAREYLNYDHILINVFNLYSELENENFSF